MTSLRRHVPGGKAHSTLKSMNITADGRHIDSEPVGNTCAVLADIDECLLVYGGEGKKSLMIKETSRW